MSWEEIDITNDDARVAADAVRMIGRHRIANGKSIHFYCKLWFGSTVVRQLGWTPETMVKFTWGAGPQIGRVRIIPITVKGAGGWALRSLASGAITVSNKNLPKNIATTEFDTLLEYAQDEVSQAPGVRFIELELPDTFYVADTRVPIKNRLQLSDGPAVAQKPPAIVKSLPPVSTTPFSSLAVNTPPPQPIPGAAPSRDDTLLDSSGICQYIRLNMGDSAQIIDARTITINDKSYTPSQALNYANDHRTRQKLAPLRLRAIQ